MIKLSVPRTARKFIILHIFAAGVCFCGVFTVLDTPKVYSVIPSVAMFPFQLFLPGSAMPTFRPGTKRKATFLALFRKEWWNGGAMNCPKWNCLTLMKGTDLEEVYYGIFS